MANLINRVAMVACALFLIIKAHSSPDAVVVFNEVHYNPIGSQENEEWIQGQTPIGYGGGENTVLTDMRGPSINLSPPYSSIYLRRKFIVESGKIPSRLLLRTYIDDGAIIWINGHEWC